MPKKKEKKRKDDVYATDTYNGRSWVVKFLGLHNIIFYFIIKFVYHYICLYVYIFNFRPTTILF